MGLYLAVGFAIPFGASYFQLSVFLSFSSRAFANSAAGRKAAARLELTSFLPIFFIIDLVLLSLSGPHHVPPSLKRQKLFFKLALPSRFLV